MGELFDIQLSRDRLYTQVADELQALIVDQQIKSGEKLPSERKLAESLGVSRTVVREAIRVLSDRGLLRIKPGCGTFVQDMRPQKASAQFELFLKLNKSPRATQELFEVRRPIEGQMAYLAAQRATEQDKQKLGQLVDMMARSLDDPEGYTDADVAFHTALASATQNSLFPLLLQPITEMLKAAMLLSQNVADASRLGLGFHQELLAALIRGDSEGARRVMLDHLDNAEQLVKQGASVVSDVGSHQENKEL